MVKREVNKYGEAGYVSNISISSDNLQAKPLEYVNTTSNGVQLAGLDNSKLQQLSLTNNNSNSGSSFNAAAASSLGAAAMNDISSLINATKGADTNAYTAAQNDHIKNNGAASLDELMAQEAASQRLNTGYTGKSLGAKSNAEIFGDAFVQSNGTFMGAMGSTNNPLVSGISAGVTLGLQSIAGAVKRHTLNKQAEEINLDNAQANYTADLNKISNAYNIMANNNQNALSHYAAFGGSLGTNGAEFPTGLRHFDAGGSHESNPYEGVQIGVDPQGVPNLVEEGETMFGNYVFSDRIKVNDKIRKAYKLGGSVKTFADASKYLSKETDEMPNDPIAKATQKKMLEKLQGEQEAIKAKKAQAEQMQAMAEQGITPEMLQQAQMEQPQISPEEQMMQEQMMQQQMGEQEYAYGGNLFDGTTGSSAVQYGVVPSELLAENALYPNNDLSLFNAILNPAEQPTNRAISTPEVKGIQQIAKDHGLGVTNMGTSFTPNGKGSGYDGITDTTNTTIGNLDPKFAPTWMRYAPVLGGAIGLGMALKKPDYSRADAVEAWAKANSDSDYIPVEFDPIGNYLQYNPLDRNYYLNKLNQSAGATRNAIINNSNGNRAAAVQGLIAAGYNDQMGIGNLARQAEEYNQALKEKVETFNRETNKFNSEMGLKAQMANQDARMKSRQFNKNMGYNATVTANKMKDDIDAARNASISTNLTNIFDNLGAIGKENVARNMREDLLASDYFGTLYTKPKHWSNARWNQYKKNLAEKREHDLKSKQLTVDELAEIKKTKDSLEAENKKLNVSMVDLQGQLQQALAKIERLEAAQNTNNKS